MLRLARLQSWRWATVPRRGGVCTPTPEGCALSTPTTQGAEGPRRIPLTLDAFRGAPSIPYNT